MKEKRPVKNCHESLVVQTHSIFPNQLNNHGTLFGGELMSMLDVAASIAVTRHARTQSVTASTDSVDFCIRSKEMMLSQLKPMYLV